MGLSEFDPAARERVSWNAGRKVGAKRALKPMQNGYVESFNGRMRDELLNETLFLSLDHVRVVISAWAEDYNQERAHSSLGHETPQASAAE